MLIVILRSSGLAAGTYCDILSDCSRQVVVKEDGSTQLDLRSEANSVTAVITSKLSICTFSGDFNIFYLKNNLLPTNIQSSFVFRTMYYSNDLLMTISSKRSKDHYTKFCYRKKQNNQIMSSHTMLGKTLSF